jgi:methylmalonyl-CoA/ethylmalonyl-CoA epimerase
MAHTQAIGLREVSLAVASIADVSAAMRTITGHAGFDVQHEPTPPVQANFQSYPVGDRSIAVMEGTAAGSPIDRFLNKRGPGPFSLTLQVADLAAFTAHLRSQHARVLLDEPMVMSDTRSGGSVWERITLNFVAPSSLTHGLVIELQELTGGTPDSVEAAPNSVLALNEVHCAVTDVDRACEDLAKLFGFDIGPLVVQEQPPEQVRFRNLSLNGRPVLAIIAPSAPSTTIQRFLDRRGPGIFSVSMRVGSQQAFTDALDAEAAGLLLPAPNHVRTTRIGADQIDSARINWIKPGTTGTRTLFEIQEYQ